MADQDAVLLQLPVQLSAVLFRMHGKYEIRLRIDNLKAQLPERFRGIGPVLHDDIAVLPVVIPGLHCRDSCRHADPVHVVGVGGILDGFLVINQGLIPDGVAHAGSCQGPGFGKCLRHHQVRIFLCQRNSRFPAEIHIGFVDEHHVIRVGCADFFNIRKRYDLSRRRVGIGDNHHASRIQIILLADGEILRQGHHFRPDMVQGRNHVIEAVGDIRKPDSVLSPGHKAEIDGFIGTVAHIYILRRYVIALRQGLLQRPESRVRIQPQHLRFFCIHRLNHGRRRRKGRLIGIQLDIRSSLGLLARCVGDQIFITGIEKG